MSFSKFGFSKSEGFVSAVEEKLDILGGKLLFLSHTFHIFKNIRPHLTPYDLENFFDEFTFLDLKNDG